MLGNGKKWWIILPAVVVAAGAIGAVTMFREKPEVETEIQVETDKAADKETDEVAADEELVDGMRPEFKEAMDSYEEFMNEYCDFLLESKGADLTDESVVAENEEYMARYADAIAAYGSWDSGEMNSVEIDYYMDVQYRVTDRYLEVTQ